MRETLNIYDLIFAVKVSQDTKSFLFTAAIFNLFKSNPPKKLGWSLKTPSTLAFNSQSPQLPDSPVSVLLLSSIFFYLSHQVVWAPW